MHHVFAIPELVLEILRHAERKRDTYHFGATCKTLWQVVEDELWGEEWDVDMLFCLVPEPVLEEPLPVVRSLDLINNLSLTKNREIVSWFNSIDDGYVSQVTASIARHSRGVKSLVLSDNWPGEDTEPSVREDECRRFCQLFKLLTQASMRPFLETLCEVTLILSMDSAVYSAFLLARLPRNFPILNIRLIRPDIWSVDVLFTFVYFILGVPCSSDLQRLTICEASGYSETEGYTAEGVDLSPDIIEDAFSRACCEPDHFASLTTLELSSISDGFHILPVLGQLPRLKALLLEFHRLEPYRRIPHRNSFPSLETVSFDAYWSLVYPRPRYHLDHVDFLNSITSPNLKAFDFSVSNSRMLFNALRVISEKWPTTFEDLRVTVDTDDNNIISLISPLSGLTALRGLTILYDGNLMLRDRDVRTIVAMSPYLRRLELVTLGTPVEDDFVVYPAATRSSLHHIAQGLPNLEHLGISIHFDLEFDVDLDSIQVAEICTADRLKLLNLSFSYCTDSNRVADFIVTLLPHLREVTGQPQTEELKRALWMKLPVLESSAGVMLAL